MRLALAALISSRQSHEFWSFSLHISKSFVRTSDKWSTSVTWNTCTMLVSPGAPAGTGPVSWLPPSNSFSQLQVWGLGGRGVGGGGEEQKGVQLLSVRYPCLGCKITRSDTRCCWPVLVSGITTSLNIPAISMWFLWKRTAANCFTVIYSSGEETKTLHSHPLPPHSPSLTHAPMSSYIYMTASDCLPALGHVVEPPFMPQGRPPQLLEDSENVYQQERAWG